MRPTLLIFLLFVSSSIFSQNLFPDPGVAFNDEVIPRIDIHIHPDSLARMLEEEHLYENHEYPASCIWDDGNNKITLPNIGFRLRGNSSRVSAKKSFKVDFTRFGGVRFFNLDEMNLNGEHNDPAIIRSKLCWDIYKMAGIPSTHANHVLLYINDVYRGLYINVEHIDKDFLKKRWTNTSGNLYKCFWGADLAFISNNPNAYKLAPFGNRVYDLKTNKQADDYTDLANFIAILNNENDPDFICQLEEVFEVDTYLRTMAMDILTANWDGPIFNKNNFYLYSNPTTGKMEYIPYDLDNTFGIDWWGIDWSNRNIYSWSQNGEPRPIYESLLSVPEYRDRMSFYMDQFISEFFNNTYLDNYLNTFQSRLSPHVVNDTFAVLDYGFTHQDFLDAYESGWGAHVPFGIKEYITKRRTAALNQIQVHPIMPALSRENFRWSESEMVFSLQAVDDSTPSVTLQYNFNNQGWQNNIPMLDNGVAPDKVAGDGYYSASVAFPGLGSIEYYFEATDGSNTRRWPRCNDLESLVGHGPVPFLFINEFMADNSYTHADNFGEYDDWLEIYNGGSSDVWLGDLFLSDDHSFPNKWQLPGVTLEAGGYMVFWCDEDQSQGDDHTNFKLSKNGEQLGLWDSEANNLAPIDTFTFGPVGSNIPWGLFPNGEGEIMELSWRTPGYSNVPLSISNPENSKIVVSPNPVTSILHIESEIPVSQIELISIDGKILEKEIKESRSFDFDLSRQVPGMYLLRVRSEGQTDQIKIIKF